MLAAFDALSFENLCACTARSRARGRFAFGLGAAARALSRSPLCSVAVFYVRSPREPLWAPPPQCSFTAGRAPSPRAGAFAPTPQPPLALSGPKRKPILAGGGGACRCPASPSALSAPARPPCAIFLPPHPATSAPPRSYGAGGGGRAGRLSVAARVGSGPLRPLRRNGSALRACGFACSAPLAFGGGSAPASSASPPLPSPPGPRALFCRPGSVIFWQ